MPSRACCCRSLRWRTCGRLTSTSPPSRMPGIGVPKGRDAARGGAPRPALAAALASCGGALVWIGCFSGVINVLLLAGSLFNLQVYDRVLASGSVPTLVALVFLVVVLYGFQGFLEFVRGRMLVRVGRALDDQLSPSIYQAIVQRPFAGGPNGDGLRPMRDLDQVRSFLASLGPVALFDLPWMPIYLGVCFLFHFWIG